MAELFGLVISLVLLAFVLLPVLTFLRLGRLSRELEELAERVRAIEQSVTMATPADASVVVPASPDTPDGPVAPETPPASVAPAEPVTPDLERRIGGRGLLYTGVVVLLFGASFFLKYAFDNAWVDEAGRVVIAAIGGVGLVALGVRLASRGLQVFGQALSGAGLAVLYLVIYSAAQFYALIDQPTAFAAMALVTLSAATLADREQSQALAFIAVSGGFVTPFLVGGDSAQLTLFAYDALLIGGTLMLALRHQWVALNGASYVLTVVTVLAWVSTNYTEGEWLRTLLFLTLFCVLFLIILRETARTATLTARLVAMGISTAPVLYHIGAVVITASHPPAIQVYLIAFTAAGLWLTADPHRPWLRLLVLLGGFAPLFGTLTLPEGISWMVPNVVTIVAVAALHLMAIMDRIVRQEATLETPDMLALHITGLGLFALLYQALQPMYPGFRGVLAAMLALGAAGLWRWLQPRERVAALNAAALAFTLAALGVAVQFDGPAVIVGWAAEGAAVVWIGVRARSVAFQFGGLLLWALSALRLFDDYYQTPANFTPIANTRALTTLFVVVMGYSLAWLFNRSDVARAGRTRAALHVAGSVLTLTWITAEIRSFWEVRFDSAQAYPYEHMMLSLAWGVYGAVLIALGMKRGYPPVRYIGMTILAMTVLKVFFFDLWELGGIYRVIGFLGFGVVLLLVSYLYQKGKADRTDTVSDPPPAPTNPDR